jgi:hypothetical protein
LRKFRCRGSGTLAAQGRATRMRKGSAVAFTVITMDNANGGTRVEHPDAVSVVIEEGHLVLRGHRVIVGIYAPGRWHSVVEEKHTQARGGLVAAFQEVSA